MIQWYRVRITARRLGERHRVYEMIGDVEATSSRAAIALAKAKHRVTVDKVFQTRGRRYTAQPMGTTEQLRNGTGP